MVPYHLGVMTNRTHYHHLALKICIPPHLLIYNLAYSSLNVRGTNTAMNLLLVLQYKYCYATCTHLLVACCVLADDKQ